LVGFVGTATAEQGTLRQTFFFLFFGLFCVRSSRRHFKNASQSKSDQRTTRQANTSHTLLARMTHDILFAIKKQVQNFVALKKIKIKIIMLLSIIFIFFL
jgi:hypothetical protein